MINCQKCNHPLTDHVSRSKMIDNKIRSFHGCRECKCNNRPIDIIRNDEEKVSIKS